MMAITTSSSTRVNPALFVRDIGSADSRKVTTLKPPTQAAVEASLVVPDRHCQSKSLQPAHYQPLSYQRRHESPTEQHGSKEITRHYADPRAPRAPPVAETHHPIFVCQSLLLRHDA